ncbi:MAG TPA: Gfo/Idh/MocA family oxidoreductase, partial [Oceanipulchritudo sp.]|nr:Gfo/Idh/MocA family oxidoreductase [Oceanipulchritudo sp.]
MLKTAIIGITGYGKEHLRLLLHGYERHLMQPVAAVCVNPGEAERELASLEKTGCRIYSSVAKLWERESGEIDLCMIPSPIGTHYTFARQAVEHG